eukprot:1194336-Prorocentrum_minimum.AAC.5
MMNKPPVSGRAACNRVRSSTTGATNGTTRSGSTRQSAVCDWSVCHGVPPPQSTQWTASMSARSAISTVSHTSTLSSRSGRSFGFAGSQTPKPRPKPQPSQGAPAPGQGAPAPNRGPSEARSSSAAAQSAQPYWTRTPRPRHGGADEPEARPWAPGLGPSADPWAPCNDPSPYATAHPAYQGAYLGAPKGTTAPHTGSSTYSSSSSLDTRRRVDTSGDFSYQEAYQGAYPGAYQGAYQGAYSGTTSAPHTGSSTYSFSSSSLDARRRVDTSVDFAVASALEDESYPSLRSYLSTAHVGDVQMVHEPSGVDAVSADPGAERGFWWRGRGD